MTLKNTKTNYHTHNSLCDGRGRLEEYVDQARHRGLRALGFSSHAPLPFANDWTLREQDLKTYCEQVRALKGNPELEVYLGLEIDYLGDLMGPADHRWEPYNLDYKIGSVHMLEDQGSYYSVDGPDEEFAHLLNQVFEGDGTALAAAYFALVGEMVEEGGFDILGHLDLIKKKNDRLAFLDEEEPRYIRAVAEVLNRLEGSGIMLEINSGGIFRGATKEVYPSPWILEEARRRKIPIVLNADAHAPEAVDFHLEESRALARRAGYREACVLLADRWQSIPL